MAMTKKERAEMDALRDALRLERAKRFTEAVAPDVPPPASGSKYDALTTGFAPIGYGSDWPRVEAGCSSVAFHSIGRNDKTDSQKPCSLYSTRELALKALRHKVEQRFLRLLVEIDKQIEAEVAHEQTKNPEA